MFQFTRLASHTYEFSMRHLRFASSGFPHSDISGSRLACSSPERFAARCVLRRPLTPRHPPCALVRLTLCEIVYFLPSLCSFQGAIYGGLGWTRTIDLTLIRRALSPPELQARVLLVEMRRFELLTPCVQGRCSPS